MAELGRAALVVTLGLAPLRARRRRVRGARTPAPRLAHVGAERAHRGVRLDARRGRRVLAAGFLRDDFSLTYVAEHSNRKLPAAYKLSAFWGGQEGSLLLWLLVLTGYAALAVWVNRNRARDLVVWVTPVLGGDRRRLRVPARRRREPVRDARRRRSTAPGSTRACRTRT